MAFVFPEDKADFTAPNGITYTYKSGKWMMKSYGEEINLSLYVQQNIFEADQSRQDEEIAVLDSLIKGVSYLYICDNTVGTTVSRPGQISSNTGFYSNINKFSFGTADATGTTTPSMSDGDIIEIYNAEESKTNRFKITNASGAPTAVNVKWISGNDFLVPNATLSVQVYPDSNVATLEARVAVGETLQDVIQNDQNIQNNQINALETQIQLLAQARAVGKWKYVRNVSNGPRPPANTTFYATNGIDSSFVVRDWADARLLMIDKTDLNGTSYTFTSFEEGDKVEILDTDGSSACYGTVTNQPNVESYGNLTISVERSSGGPRDDKEYVISVYRPGAVSGDVDLDILDNRYLVKTGDVMSGPLNFKRGEKDSNQFKISPNGDDYFTNLYAYNSGGMRFRVTPGDTDANYKTVISAAWSSHVVDGQTHPVELAINWLRNPTQPHHAANKAYVDATAGSGGGMQLDLWTYKGTKSDGSSLGDGEFASKKLAGNVLELYLGRRNSRGVFYHPTPANSTSEYYHQVTQSSQNGSPLTVTQQDGRCVWFAETKKLIFNKGSANYSVIEAIHYRGAVDLLIEGNQYMLNIPGLIGPVSGW